MLASNEKFRFFEISILYPWSNHIRLLWLTLINIQLIQTVLRRFWYNVLGSILFKLFNKIDIYSLYTLDRDKNVDFSKYQLPTFINFKPLERSFKIIMTYSFNKKMTYLSHKKAVGQNNRPESKGPWYPERVRTVSGEGRVRTKMN